MQTGNDDINKGSEIKRPQAFIMVVYKRPLNQSCISNNGILGFAKLGPCLDRIKPLLGPSLENRIRATLEEFVCESNSDCAKRFPRAKKFLNTVAAWADRLDVSAKDTDIRQEMIKHTIEFLLKDGLVTQFADPAILNRGSNKLDADSLVAEQNALKTMNVWRFINEKDYWLCQDCATATCVHPETSGQIYQCGKQRSGSDLDVEVGSISQESSTVYSSCRTNSICSSVCNRTIESTKSQVKINCRNFEVVLEPNGNIVNSRKNISNTFDNTSCCSRRESLKKFGLKVKFDCDTKFVQTETSGKNLNFIFKASASTLNPLKEAFGTKCDRKFAQTQTSQKDINFIFTANHPKDASDTKGDAKFVHTQTSERNINFIFEASSDTLNAPKGTSDIPNFPKPSPRRKYLKSSDAKAKCDCDRTKSPKKPKLKIYIHRTMSTSRSDVRSPLNVSNLSLPCKSSQLIVRLFEADPSLSDSCLILMRKRFEKDINNACSCINDILKKLDDSTIKQLHLNCEIRPGRVDLNLSCKNGESSKIRWFLARVPTCSNVHKRVSYTGSVESCENPRDRRGEPRRSMELPVDAGCCEDAAKRSGEFEERRVAFYSVCSNHSLMEVKSSTLGNQIEKEEKEKQLNLAWAAEGEKQMDFVLSSRLINSQDKHTVTSAKTGIERPGKYNNEISDRKIYQSTSLNREEEGLERCRTEEAVDVNKEIEICDDGFVEDSIQDSENHLIELYDIKCDCSLDSFEEGVFRNDYSTTRGCNPEERSCDAFSTGDSIVNHSSSETEDLDNKNTKVEDFCPLNEDALKLQVSTSQMKKNNSKLEDCVSKNTSCLGIEREVVRNEERVFELEQNIFQMENASKEEISSLGFKEKEKVISKVEEKYSADSICASNSSSMELGCDTKCSCCGEDLPNSSSVEKINVEANKRPTCTNKALANLKDHEILNLIVTENATTSEAVRESSNLRYLEFKMAPNVYIESNTTSIHDQSSTVTDNNSTDFSQKCLGNCEKNSIENPCDQEATFIDNPPNFSTCSKVKDSPITESLFVFCNSNVKQFSSTSNSSTDEECSSNENHRARSQEIGKSPCRRAIPTKCHRKSIYSITCKPSYSMRNVARVNCAKHSSKEKTNEKDVPIVPRYKNRLWRGPMAPGSLCSSFPAIDRIKYLIRKKLRKLLLEERDKGTSTSKTFLRNDRYLVSISSGKLNGGRIIRESCSSTRCPFTTRNRYETRGEAEKTFTEGSCLGKNKNIFGDIIKARCQRMIQGNDIFKRIRMANVSRSQKYDSKLTDTQDFIGERGETIGRCKWKARNGERFLVNSSWSNKEQKNCSSIVPLSSKRMLLSKDDGDHFLSQKPVRQKHRDSKDQGKIKNLSTDTKSMRNYPRRSYYERGFSGSSYERKEKENRKGMDAEDKTCYDKLRSFEERLSKLERRRDEENNFVNFLSDYEKRVNELDADFRLKLLQYVTLCRSVKNSLMKRLRLDDVYEVNSSSV